MKGERMKNTLKPQIFDNWSVPLQENKKPFTAITDHYFSKEDYSYV